MIKNVDGIFIAHVTDVGVELADTMYDAVCIAVARRKSLRQSFPVKRLGMARETVIAFV